MHEHLGTDRTPMLPIPVLDQAFDIDRGNLYGASATECVLFIPQDVVSENELAFVRYDDNSRSPGHVLVVPRRPVAIFFGMTVDEQHAVLSLLDQAKEFIEKQHKPDGYNIGANIGVAGGQSRIHVHVHLIPRYHGDHADPKGGVRCVLAGKCSS